MGAKKLLISLIVLAAIASFIPEIQADEKIDLELNLKPGQKFGTAITTDQNIEQSFMGQTTNTTQKVKIQIVSEVLGVDANGNYDVKTTYKDFHAKGKVESPNGSFEFDSKKPEDANNPQAKMMGDIFKHMTGIEFVMKLTPKGKIAAIEGFDEMIDKMASAMDDPNAARAMKQTMKAFMSEDKLTEMNSDMMVSFPDHPVGIGDMWDTVASIGGAGMPIEIDVTYVLKERKNGMAILDVSSKMDMGTEDGKLMEMNGMKVNMLMTGTQTGTTQIDETTGWYVRGKANMKYSITMKMQPNPQMPDGMTIPMTIQGTTTIEPFDVE